MRIPKETAGNEQAKRIEKNENIMLTRVRSFQSIFCRSIGGSLDFQGFFVYGKIR